MTNSIIYESENGSLSLDRLAAMRDSFAGQDTELLLIEAIEAFHSENRRLAAIVSGNYEDTQLIDATFSGGEFSIALAQGPVPYLVEYLAQMLGHRQLEKPLNYTAVDLQHREFGPMTLTLQRKNGRSPQAAAAEHLEALRAIRPLVGAQAEAATYIDNYLAAQPGRDRQPVAGESLSRHDRVDEVARIIDPHSFLPIEKVDGDEWTENRVEEGMSLARSKARRILDVVAAGTRGPCFPVTYCGLATSTHVPSGSDEEHCDLCGHPAQPLASAAQAAPAAPDVWPIPAHAKWCQPGDMQDKRQFLVRFDDPDCRDSVFNDEAEARAFYAKATVNWNCYLFGALEAHPAAILPSLSPDVAGLWDRPIKELAQAKAGYFWDAANQAAAGAIKESREDYARRYWQRWREDATIEIAGLAKPLLSGSPTVVDGP